MNRTMTPRRGGRGHGSTQAGQALVESLVAMLALVVLWGALHWLAHYQDIGLSSVHASRHAAFAATRTGADEPGQEIASHFFTGSAHRWVDRRGEAVLDAQAPFALSWQRLRPLSPEAQPAGRLMQAATLRRDWQLDDRGILQARIAAGFAVGRGDGAPTGIGNRLQLHVFDHSYPPLARSIGILTGAGHAPSDAQVQNRIGASALAWSGAQSASRLSGGSVQLRADGVDMGWSRPAPTYDWLQPWSGRVPGHLIAEYAQTEQGGD